MNLVVVAWLAAAASQSLAASPLPEGAQAAAATVDAFHRALEQGNTEAAAKMLSEDVLVFESGGAERSKAEYAAHHLAADAEFARAVASSLARRTGGASGDLAWVSTEARATGAFRGRQIDQKTVETMILRRGAQGWKIVHVHWSSAR